MMDVAEDLYVLGKFLDISFETIFLHVEDESDGT